MLRKVITTYTFKRNVKKVNRSQHIDRAILNAVMHMQRNEYRASIAQVSCDETGKLYAIITRNMTGRIKIHYKDNSVFVFEPASA